MSDRNANPTPEANDLPENIDFSAEEVLRQRSWQIFERVRPDLIKDRHDWFIAIDPKSEEYFIDADEVVATEKLREKHPHATPYIFRINETGACGKI